MVNFTFIQTTEQLSQLKKELMQYTELAIDLECENSLHHYGTFLCLVQISSSNKNWIIDILQFKDITPLKEVLENKNILKVFHDVSFDFRILNYQFNIHPKNVFDTQMATLLLGKEKLGLSSLLDEYFGIKKDSRFQRVNWCRRPLSPQMLEYAVKDTAYLLKLKLKLEETLSKLNRLSWLKEECTALDNLDFTYEPQIYLDLSGAKKLPPRELGLLHALFDLRENTAKRINLPAFMIMGNKLLMGLAASPVTEISAFRNLHGIHPIVRTEAKTWVDATKKALSGSGENYVSHYKKLTPEQSKKKEEFTELRNEAAKQLGLRGHILASEEQIIEMVVSGTSSPLKEWQREVLKKELLKLRL
jgi:ribonuclease D